MPKKTCSVDTIVSDFDSQYPGISLYKIKVIRHLTSSEATVDCLHDIGVLVHVPEHSLSSTEEAVKLHIQPCFNGPFELPSEYDSASPTFLIHPSRSVDFKKDITVKIHHHVSLQSEEDCEDMVFLSASSTPEYRESHPVYTFKKISGVKTVFRPGDQVGEIALKHFCLIRNGKRKRKVKNSDTTSKKHQGTYKNYYCYYVHINNYAHR